MKDLQLTYLRCTELQNGCWVSEQGVVSEKK